MQQCTDVDTQLKYKEHHLVPNPIKEFKNTNLKAEPKDQISGELHVKL